MLISTTNTNDGTTPLVAISRNEKGIVENEVKCSQVTLAFGHFSLLQIVKYWEVGVIIVNAVIASHNKVYYTLC